MIQTLILHYTPNQQDYVKVLRLFLMQHRSTRVSLGVLVIAFGLLCYGMIRQHSPPSVFEWLWLLIPPLFVAYTYFLQPARLANRAIQNEQLATEATWEVSDDGVKITNRFNSSTMGWDSLAKLVTSKEYYLLLNKVNRNAFRFLPKRAFSSQEEEAQFLALMRAHLTIA